MSVNKVKGYRTMLNLTQEEMANKIGISTRTYVDRELGKLDFSTQEANLIISIIKKEIPTVTYEDIFF